MKKIFAFLLLILTLTVLGLLTVGAVDDSIEIPYAQNAPVIDGVLSEGEYPGEALVMNDRTAEAWVGSMTPETSTVWHFAWDDTGLYVFATVKDKTPVYRGTNGHWVGADCVEIGLNPGYVLKKSDDKGVFFSMGAMADGNVVVYRHNYDERILSSKVDGCSLGHTEGSSSYTVEVCIPVFAAMIDTMRVLPENMRKAAGKGFINATDCADYLTKKGVPFRDAYKLTGCMVSDCIAANKVLEDLTVAEFKAYSELFEEDVLHAIDLVTCCEGRASYGGPTAASVRSQIRQALAAAKEWEDAHAEV